MTDDLAAALAAPPDIAAPRLLGATLLFNGVGGIIVETEAYAPSDPASHSYRGRTPRVAPMFGPVGGVYVYRIYGLHWCFNIVCDTATPGSAVLIRALEPTHGIERMIERRGMADVRALCSGPARLCQALGITGNESGARVDQAPFSLQLGPPSEALVGARIGLTKAAEVPWRFGAAGSRFLSKPFRSG